jgi:phage terminase small subunit
MAKKKTPKPKARKKTTPKKKARKTSPKAKRKSSATQADRQKGSDNSDAHTKQINTEGITDKRLRFIEYYVIHLNATKAAKLAGYSATSAGSIGTQLLSDERIREVLAKRLDARSRRLEVKADRVLLDVAAMAYSNIDDFATWSDFSVHMKPCADVTRIQKASIKSLNPKFDREGNALGVHITLHDKPRAAELLMRHLGMLDPTGRQDTKGTIVAFMERLKKGED